MIKSHTRLEALAMVKLSTKLGLRKFYREQLHRFNKIGIGNKTEFGTVVTETLINVTERRLKELTKMEIDK
tara:strand:+ start:139 stop:351 length:213 start_codon:yes stop_codon:yes gene_type:complete